MYSPKTTYPDGDPFQAIAIVGTVTGAGPAPRPVIPGGFRRRAVELADGGARAIGELVFDASGDP